MALVTENIVAAANADAIQRTTVTSLKQNQWLASEHPIYTSNKWQWRIDERRMRGGKEIECDLIPFDWETPHGEHHSARKEMLTYLNFADRYATLIVGHMMREAPTPGETLDFGTLGEVSRRTANTAPTPAELVYFNTDGKGVDGSQWDNFWTHAGRWAVCTGHRWVLAQGPIIAPKNRQEEINGLRPFLRHLSPLSVTNWEYRNGSLAWAIVQQTKRQPAVTADGIMGGNLPTVEYMLLVREGVTTFNAIDDIMSIGGWFIFDADGALTGEAGFWDSTEGAIPMFPLFYERVTDSECPSMSRSGVTEMNKAAIAYMNIASAADFDVWDSATTVRVLEGVDDDSFNLFVAKMKGGNRYVPLRPPASNPQGTVRVSETAGAAQQTGQAFDQRLMSKRKEVLELMLNEIQLSTDSSGTARQASFTDVREPRLALFAAELESAQNTAIFFLEQLWGNDRPSGSVEWPRQFKIIDPIPAALEFFTVEKMAGLTSPTLDAKILTQAARDSGMLGDDDEERTVLKEFEASAKERQTQEAQMNALFTSATSRPGPTTKETVPTERAPGTPGSKQPAPKGVVRV